MQHLEVSGAVRYIYIYIYIIRRLKVKHKRRTFIPSTELELAIPVIELPLNYALDLMATGSALNGPIITILSLHYAAYYNNVMCWGPSRFP